MSDDHECRTPPGRAAGARYPQSRAAAPLRPAAATAGAEPRRAGRTAAAPPDAPVARRRIAGPLSLTSFWRAVDDDAGTR